ncbi:MAG TPA: asparagine synthase (glutamine-hydrolyzing) [Stellaceae bacterium]|jgi:asparagine synthase (glutamine-hydrolysing)|nr:asparagine synthase (glutamine-hydrolyzing) [Stellaceae bacterium]
MCGVAGLLNFDGEPASAKLLDRMGESIRHRGPDDDGVFTEGALGLASRRLAIIDLSPAGHQPMSTSDGRFVMVYNGELYNFRELKLELEALGHRFRSSGDSEVALAAFAQWDTAAIARFNGMFALAIWDRQRHRLVLARDRYGVKPLYYAASERRLLFASEVKAFLQHPDFSVGVDPETLLEYFTFQNVLTDRTLFRDVRMLPAGSFAVIEADGRTRLETYWDFHFAEPAQIRDPREYVEETDRLVRQAVRRQLVSDAPVGAYLSGGMDSGAVTAVAAKEIPHLTSITVGFDLSSASGLELGFDERARAERLSYLFQTEHYEAVLKAGDLERVMPTLVWHLEDLRVGQCYPNYYAARLASKFCKVVLAGTGGDELFAGYPWRYYRAVNNVDFEDYVQKYYKFWQRLVPNKVIHRLFQPHIWERVKDRLTVDIFRDVLKRHAPTAFTPETYVNQSLYFECKAFLHGLLLVEDKLSMAHSLENRVPFLDNDLVDFAVALPVRMKLRDLEEVVRIDENEVRPKQQVYFERTNDGKLILREALKRLLPDDYVTGTKQGFSGPDASWFRGESMAYVERLLLDPRARIYQFLRHDTVTELIREHLSGQHNRRLLIWSLLCFEWWLRLFLEGGWARQSVRL